MSYARPWRAWAGQASDGRTLGNREFSRLLVERCRAFYEPATEAAPRQAQVAALLQGKLALLDQHLAAINSSGRQSPRSWGGFRNNRTGRTTRSKRSEEHTSELQSH